MRRSRRSPEFIIHTPPYDDKIGGVVALFALCEKLNQLGYTAAIWPWDKPRLHGGRFVDIVKYVLKRKWRRYRGPMRTPIAGDRDIGGAITIYPEVVAGNPLGSRRVVRWLLHKPGYHTGEVAFGKDDLFFFYQEAFDDENLNPHRDHLLQISYLHPAYREWNRGPRSGTCVVFRKGRGRVHDRHPDGAIVLDDLTHEETAAALNASDIMYSYDTYTFYSVYAIVCGCVPVILPEEGVAKTGWCPAQEMALGVAYGVDEVEQARAERPQFLRRLSERQKIEEEAVHRFVSICRTRYGHSDARRRTGGEY